MSRVRTLIMGAAGRDFHNFNVVYRENPDFEVLAFTAAQIPNIKDRRYPAELAGRLYPLASLSTRRRSFPVWSANTASTRYSLLLQ